MMLHEEVPTRESPLPKLLEKTVAGLWFLRNELAEYMDDGGLSKLSGYIDDVWKRAVVLHNQARPFMPSFRFRQDEDDLTVVHLLVLLPGPHFNQGTLVGEVRMNTAVVDGQLVLSPAQESGAHALARQHRWKASEEELQALDELISSATRLKRLARSFPVNIAFTDHGIEIGANYHDPAAPVRAALRSI
ncbi:hypothetical protein HDG34_003104 [Paraburkholderia sp. HC6.4b]|uniref:hypothetical protein n=1 Tax=unclassified Paraburkholderia TaxID=2615204 RepID=UPI00160B4D4E|nr:MULTISPECIES: hypothetical protein [unclassified Paraburkholderia]MBB5409163.1 hypothetical protein [Paraburkholderia sp. HC6.4b]MBB5450891.1 hypothetical protein [Paraburkholderia sp. Kb1A]